MMLMLITDTKQIKSNQILAFRVSINTQPTFATEAQNQT